MEKMEAEEKEEDEKEEQDLTWFTYGLFILPHPVSK